MHICQIMLRLLKQQITHLRRERIRWAAMQSAHTIIAHRFPIWVESGFTKGFLQNDASPLMEPFLQGGDLPDPHALATAWTAVYRFSDAHKQRAINQILPVMVDYVYVLKGELRYFEG